MLELETLIEKTITQAARKYDLNRVQIALNACIQRLPDRKKEILTLFDEEKHGLAIEHSHIIVGSEIEEAVRGKMVVPEYSQRESAKQEIYVFVNTHWEVAQIQVYYDFIKDAARAIGLSEVYVQNQKYMNRVFENVAFRLSKHVTTVQPEDGVWINLKNCTVEITPDSLSEGKAITTHEHDASDFFKYCLPYSYNPSAECPRWKAFLDEVLPEKESQALLGEYIGYCFTQNLKLEKMAVFYGSGANGKSVVMDVVKNLIGRCNVSEATLSSVTNNPEVRSVLENKLVNISSESGRSLDAAVLKMMISGEPVEMRKLYVGTRILNNPPKLITSYNILPPQENTLGYRRRWLLFPFNITIPADRQDPSLVGKLCTELPGILNWVLGHLANLIKRVSDNSGKDFTESPLCNTALDEYFKSANSVTMFLNEACKKDDTIQNKQKDLYNDYLCYCRASGITKPCNLKNFKKELEPWGASKTVKHDINFYNIWVDRSVYE